MRQFRVRLSPERGWFHLFEKHVDQEPAIRRVAIHKIRLVDDEYGLTLYELSGSFGRTKSLLDDLTGSLDYQVDEFDGRIFVYSPLVLKETVRELLRIPRDFEMFLDPPMTYTRDGDLQVTYLASESSFTRAILPPNVVNYSPVGSFSSVTCLGYRSDR